MGAEIIPDMTEVVSLLLAATGPMREDRKSDRFLPVIRALVDAGGRGMTQVQLASALGLNPASVSRIVDMLEQRDLLTRIDHPLDRRCKVIQLTDRGRACAERCAHSQQERCKSMFKGLCEQDLATLKGLLRQVVSNLKTG